MIVIKVFELEAAAWAAGCDCEEPADRSMTRHDMVEPKAAGGKPTATDPRLPMVNALVHPARLTSLPTSNSTTRGMPS